jgi:hypothetical protein
MTDAFAHVETCIHDAMFVDRMATDATIGLVLPAVRFPLMNHSLDYLCPSALPAEISVHEPSRRCDRLAAD